MNSGLNIQRSRTMFCSLKQVLLLVMLISTTSLIAQNSSWYSYFSPGIQIGYGFGEGVFLGSQITYGGIFRGYDSNGNRQNSDLFPGTTIGVRKYFGINKQFMGYLDFQVVYKIIIGSGVGISATKSINSNAWAFGSRYKIWGGSIGLLSYDVTKQQDAEKIHNIGLMGVIPFTEASFID